MTAPPAEAPTTRRRRLAVWAAIAVTLVLVGAGAAAILGAAQWAQPEHLDPDSAAPEGTRALVHVLRDQGVEVVAADDLDAAASALSGRDATLVLGDTAPLSDAAVGELAEAAADVVLLHPGSRDLRLLLDGSATAGVGTGDAVPPDCALGEARRAGPLTVGEVYTATGTATACYPSGDGHGLIVAGDDGGRVTAVDADDLFVNAALAADGNAALAVNLMGRHPVVVWFLPDLADSDLAPAAPTLGELTPDWVTPAVVVLAVAGIAAAMWRGRRFGPLVAETLPVTVRAEETTQGRARLYARARDPLHAADALRSDALARIAGRLGLGAAATPTQIADAAASLVGAPHPRVRGILIDSIPVRDADLVALADDLQTLETAVDAALRPERNPQ